MAEFSASRTFPLVVQYCGVCSYPLEYCVNGTAEKQAECRAWAAAHSVDAVSEQLEGVKLTDKAASAEQADSGVGIGFAEGDEASAAAAASSEPAAAAAAADGEEDAAAAEKKAKRAAKKKEKAAPVPMVKIGRVSRNKRKFITIVGGLGSFPDVKMKDAAKLMGKQFACGCSVNKTASGAEEITIQGDVLMDLPPFLQSAFHIPHDRILIVE
jgi:density-regulated protein